MATIDWKAINTKLGKRCETYALKVRSIMEQRIGEVVAMCEGLVLIDGKPFAFADYPEISRKVQATFRLMYSEIYQSIRGNITQEWYYSNADMDGLLAGLFGKGAMQDRHFARYFARNKEAMQQFFARKENGMNLSQRVWAIAGNTKQDMEVALDLALGQGVDAGELSRTVRKYLQEPDMLFRRFRYREQEPVLDDKGKPMLGADGKPLMHGKVDENGNPVYGRKWKRRHYDKETGNFYWVDDNPHNYHTGRGVYRSSYKNAMRLARTETNMAYRAADCERWKAMEFMRGFRVVLSKNHPCDDICNDLSADSENDTSGKGEYPKGFVFKGWHPHCYCYCVPLLCTEDELFQLTDQILRGEDTSGFAPAGMIEQPNEQFMQWVENNKDRIAETTSERGWGGLPYFLQDNYNSTTGKGNWVQDIKNEAGLDTWGKVLQKGEIDITKYSNVQSVLADDLMQASNYVDAADMPLLTGNARLGEMPLSTFAQLEDEAFLHGVLQQGKFGANGLLGYTSEAELAELERIATQLKFASKTDGTFVSAINSTDLQAILSGDTAVFGAGRYVGTNYSQTLASALKNGIVGESEGAVAVLKLPKGSRYAQMLVDERPAALLLPNAKFKVVSSEVKTIVQAGKATKVTHYTLELVEDGSAQVQQVIQAMKQAKADVRAYNKAVKVGENVVSAFNKGKYELLGLDTSALDIAIASGDTATIQAEAKALAKQMAAAKKAALAQAQSEPVEWVLAQEFGEADAKAFMTNWAKHMAKAGGLTEQEFLKKVIEKELYYANLNPTKYPTTGKFIEYFEKLKTVYQDRIALAAIQPDIDAAIVFAQTTKSAKVKNMVMELQALATGSSPDLSAVKTKLAAVEKEIQRIEKERLKRLAKSGVNGLDMTSVYTPADLKEYNKLHREFEDALAVANGNYRAYEVRQAQDRLADYVTNLGVKYHSANIDIPHIGGATPASIRDAINDWLNAVDLDSRFGVYHHLGGVYQEAACAGYASKIGVAARELSILRRYTAGQSFVNEYACGLDDYKSYIIPKLKSMSKALTTDPKNPVDLVAEFEAWIDKYITAYNGVCEKLPRYNSHTYRGCRRRKYPVAFDGMVKDLQDSFATGKPWISKNPMSTSRKIAVADGFGDDMTFLVRGKTGVDVNPISRFKGEDEYVFRAGSRFRVLKMYRATKPDIAKVGSWVVELQEIL
nr:MAG TPA: minor capsid protein [Caudoviricetes sp.]